MCCSHICSQLLVNSCQITKSSHVERMRLNKCVELVHERIHTCLNDCNLYPWEFAKFNERGNCFLKHYKIENSPIKVMWYFPLIHILKRMYDNVEDAKNLT